MSNRLARFLPFLILPLITGLFSGAASAQTSKTVIKCGRLLDVRNGEVRENTLILISGDRIESVGNEITIPENAAVIDLSGQTVLPGLIDAHTHICLTPDYTDRNPVLYKSLPYRTIEGVHHAQLNLQAGFTTLRDVDSEGANFADASIRDAIDNGLIEGPRLQVSTLAISITGGHMNISGLAPHIDVPQLAALADTPGDMIKEVRRQIKFGADWIKIYTTGTLRHIDPETLEPLTQMSVDEVRMIVEECKRWGVPVAAHAYGGEGATNAILGGVRSIEHGFFLNEKQLRHMVNNGTYFCPTMSVYVASADENPEDALRQKIVEAHKKTLKKAVDLGVKVVFGTDVGAFEHGTGAREFKYMVDAGMTPMRAIQSATVVAAELMHLQDSVGSIEKGKLADIIAVEGDPLKNIETLMTVTFVMKGGQIIKNATGISQTITHK